VVEIDVGGPRWNEDATGVWDSIASYLRVDDFSQWPQARYQRGVAQAEEAIDRLAEASGVRGGEIRRLAHAIREMFGARETPKFAIVQCLGMFRQSLQESGADLARVGALSEPDDIFFLTLDELPRAFVGGWDDLVSERRFEYERESRRTRVPRVLVSDGRAFFDGVSPGVVEGVVRVVSDPSHAGLTPGAILVCRGTSPAWTPLFGIAGGLVTEVGGLMTHGAVVAREYGLPAIVGVTDATTRLVDGQRVRLDGSSGAITLL
jgi:pyruvate,water dikinase